MTWSKKYRKVNFGRSGSASGVHVTALSYDSRTNTYEWQLKLVPAPLSEEERRIIERNRLNAEKAGLIKAMVIKQFKNPEISAALSKMFGRGYGLRTVAKYAALFR